MLRTPAPPRAHSPEGPAQRTHKPAPGTLAHLEVPPRARTRPLEVPPRARSRPVEGPPRGRAPAPRRVAETRRGRGRATGRIDQHRRQTGAPQAESTRTVEEAGAALRRVDPLVGAVGELLVLPDRQPGLGRVDQVRAGRDGFPPMRRRLGARP